MTVDRTLDTLRARRAAIRRARRILVPVMGVHDVFYVPITKKAALDLFDRAPTQFRVSGGDEAVSLEAAHGGSW